MPIYMLHPLLAEPLELPDVAPFLARTAEVLDGSAEAEVTELHGQSISELPLDQREELLEKIRADGGSLSDIDLS
ncbi:hypothetical protein [Pseudomonas soli]|uniref:hypothetical protein n=1 Tax=Pseudomonas soli TaxID=1306993 RepID=UPI003DA95A77